MGKHIAFSTTGEIPSPSCTACWNRILVFTRFWQKKRDEDEGGLFVWLPCKLTYESTHSSKSEKVNNRVKPVKEVNVRKESKEMGFYPCILRVFFGMYQYFILRLYSWHNAQTANLRTLQNETVKSTSHHISNYKNFLHIQYDFALFAYFCSKHIFSLCYPLDAIGFKLHPPISPSSNLRRRQRYVVMSKLFINQVL